MDFSIEKKISNFIESQFPQFYLEEGENFVMFVKAYYEWLESEGNAVREARKLEDYRDIDNTMEDFLVYFQKKYLYGIPFNIIINKRYLLKHILDVYRSKGSIQCYKLLFKLIYNQDIDVYLPGTDVFKPSDGTWYNPKYIEVTDVENLAEFVGTEIIGISSGTTAIVESYNTEIINNSKVSTLYISNILPLGGTFEQGEKVLRRIDEGNPAALDAAPSIVGSLDRILVIDGGQGYHVGEVVKVVHRDIVNNAVNSFGVDGELRITEVIDGNGGLKFEIEDGGFGFTTNASCFVYRGIGDNSGENASFSLGPVAYQRSISFNTDVIVDYYDTPLNSTSFGLPASPSANISSTLDSCLTTTSKNFGTIAALTNVRAGNTYTNLAATFVRSSQTTRNALPGQVIYYNYSNTVIGVGTMFAGNSSTTFFEANDVIVLQATSNPNTKELAVIKEVVSNTELVLYGPPKYSSTLTSTYKTAPTILPSNYAIYEPDMSGSTVNKPVGENENVYAFPSSGTNIVANAYAVNSGKGYIDGETVTMYLANGLGEIEVAAGGTGYANNEKLEFAGGGTNSVARGYVITDGSGTITSCVLQYSGSGYQSIPAIRVKTANGSGAVLRTTIEPYNTFSQIIGKVIKTGVGRTRGYWTTSRSFLDNDKYIQDSYFYQDYSYQIKVAATLDKYKDILYKSFHTAGSELFGKYLNVIVEEEPMEILHENLYVL